VNVVASGPGYPARPLELGHSSRDSDLAVSRLQKIRRPPPRIVFSDQKAGARFVPKSRFPPLLFSYAATIASPLVSFAGEKETPNRRTTAKLPRSLLPAFQRSIDELLGSAVIAMSMGFLGSVAVVQYRTGFLKFSPPRRQTSAAPSSPRSPRAALRTVKTSPDGRFPQTPQRQRSRDEDGKGSRVEQSVSPRRPRGEATASPVLAKLGSSSSVTPGRGALASPDRSHVRDSRSVDVSRSQPPGRRVKR
jgi:hypothetical protein